MNMLSPLCFATRTTRFCRMIMYLVLASTSTIAAAQAGQLDSTFASNGIFFSSGTTSTTVALQSNGQIVVGGSSGEDGAVIRLNTNGTLDKNFGTGGTVLLKFADINSVVTGMAVQSDGKILVVGTGLPQGGSIMRLNTDGSIDSSFGTNGSTALTSTPGLLVLLASGEFLVTTTTPGTINSMIQRFESNGALDASFGTGGSAPISGNTAIALESNGKILLTSVALGPGNASISRYNANGSLDGKFGVTGQTATLNGAAVAVQGNGIVSVGTVVSQLALGGNSTGFGVQRFNSNGMVEAKFGTRGGVMTTFPNSPATGATAVLIQPNGDIVAGGEAGTSTPFGSDLVESFALARYLSNGQLDNSFGTGGLVTTSFGSSAQAKIVALALQSDGKIVAVGNNQGIGLIVARYLGQ